MEAIFAEYDAEIYEKTALIKAAYAFIHEFYIHLERNDHGNYLVRFTPKTEAAAENVVERFENELLAQVVRQHVYRETKNLREIMVARAMASSMIVEDDVADETVAEAECAEKYDLEDILTDWFKHGNT